MIWLPEDVVGLMRTEADRLHPLETGGVLIGYRAEGQAVVTEATGPGPRARHGRTWFEFDGEFHAAAIAERHRATEGRETYLGDWHTHPDATHGALSGDDRRALKRVITSPEARTPAPYSVLLFGRPGDWSVRGWIGRLKPRRLLPASVALRPLDIKIYGP